MTLEIVAHVDEQKAQGLQVVKWRDIVMSQQYESRSSIMAIFGAMMPAEVVLDAKCLNFVWQEFGWARLGNLRHAKIKVRYFYTTRLPLRLCLIYNKPAP